MAENTGAEGATDATNTTTQQPDPAETAQVEARARTMGWTPKDRWHGNPANWMDAATWVKRSEHIIPVLRSQTQTLEQQLQAEREARAKLEVDLKGATEAINTLQGFKGEVEERMQGADEQALARRLKEARDSGDTLAEVQVMRELAAVQAKPAAAAPPKKEEPKPAPAQVDWRETPYGRDWLASNAWWNDNRRMRAMFLDIGQEMAASGALNGMTPEQRLRAVGDATLREFGSFTRNGAANTTKVEGGRAGAAGESGEGEHSFADLPPEARDAMKRQAKYLVGPGKRFKTEADWQKHYVAAYFTDTWGTLQGTGN